MKTLIKSTLMLCATLAIFTYCESQINHSKTDTVKIYGNCGMCKKTIEKAGNIETVASVNWDKVTKMAIITFDSTKTNRNEILKRISLAGYDSDLFRAPDNIYNNLHVCCQYERKPLEKK